MPGLELRDLKWRSVENRYQNMKRRFEAEHPNKKVSDNILLKGARKLLERKTQKAKFSVAPLFKSMGL